MADRRNKVASAAIQVIANFGLRGLTHRAVDAEAKLPSGSTSNYFRTRESLIEGAVQRMADIELEQLTAAEALGPEKAAAATFGEWAGPGLAQTLVRLELMIEAARNPSLERTLASQRERFIVYMERFGSPADVGLTASQMVALLAGLQFAEITTGESLMEPVVSALSRNTSRPATTE